MKPFDAYEISPCRRFEEPGKPALFYFEVCEPHEAQFWTLYGHIPGEGVMAIGDFATREGAEEVFYRITGIPFAETGVVQERLRVMHAGARLLGKVQAVAELRRRWRSQDEEETIDSVEYMDGLDELDLDAAIAMATGRAV